MLRQLWRYAESMSSHCITLMEKDLLLLDTEEGSDDMRRGFLVVLALAGCDAGVDDVALDPELASRRIAEVVRTGDAIPSCGDEAATALVPTALVIVTADLCLSCLNVSFALRELGRVAADSLRPHVVIPREESEELCSILRREKVRLPVLSVPSSAFGRSVAHKELLFVDLDADLAPVRIERAATGPRLLDVLRDPEPDR